MTELDCNDLSAKIKLEGELTEATLPIFAEALDGYAQQGVRSLGIDAEGLLRVDQSALEKVRPHLPDDLHLLFYTSRPTIQYQLKSCGFDAP